MATDNFILLPFFYGALWFLLPGQRSSNGHHRCVTPLYCIPMWIFYCVADGRVYFLRNGSSKLLAHAAFHCEYHICFTGSGEYCAC